MDRPLLFGKYCLLERISVGGMAEVFRGKPLDPPDPDHYFAVKRILPHLAEDVEFIKMFVDEARLTVQLEHPNIVETYELGQFQSSHYIVMEFIAGKDLLAFQKHVRNQGTIFDVDMACHIVGEVARGLNYAHNKTDEDGNHLGIIHRDVSPQNVLVSWDGRVRIIDFGIAKATSQSTKTKAGVMKGKFGYMSPEQVQGEEIDHRSDIFAMGTVLWELLTNQRLFKAGNQLEAMTMIGEPDVDPPSTINDEIPAEVDAIVMKMLAEDPNDRYHWGDELAEDIDEYLEGKNPPFHPSQLTTWVRNAFREDFEEEKRKRAKFREINTAEDVRRQFDAPSADSPEASDGPDDSGATDVWDVDEAPDSDADLENFVSDHTVVQAGGLDESDFDEWDDAPDTIDETEDVVESRIDVDDGAGSSSSSPSPRVQISADSQYQSPDSEADYAGEETVITNPESSPGPPGPNSPSAGAGQGGATARASAAETPPEGEDGEEPATALLDKAELAAGPPDAGDGSATAQAVPPESASESGPADSSATARARPPNNPGEPTSESGTDSQGLPDDLPPEPGADSDDQSPEEGTVTAGSMTAAPTPPGGMTRSDSSPTDSADSPLVSLPSLPDVDGVSVSPKKVLAALAIVVGVMTVAAAAYLVVEDSEDEPAVPAGQLRVEVEPVDADLDIFVDGDWVGDTSPLAVGQFKPDSYTVEVDHPDYPAWRDEVTVYPDETTTAEVGLEDKGGLVIRWDGEPDWLALFVDGDRIDVGEAGTKTELEVTRGSYQVEAFARGHRPIRESVEVEADSVSELELDWTPVDHLTLQGDEEVDVKLDGEVRARQLPVVLTALELDRIYELEVGEQRVALGYPALGHGQMDRELIADYEQFEPEDYGRVVLDYEIAEPWHLVVEEVGTGLVTPLEDVERLPVVAGHRTLGLERGDVRHEFEVRVVEGETTYVRVAPGG